MKRRLLLLATEDDRYWAALYRIERAASPKLLRYCSGTRAVPLWVKLSSLLHPALLLPKNVPFAIRNSSSQAHDGLLNNLGIPLAERELQLGNTVYTLCAREASLSSSLQQVTDRSVRISGVLPIPAVLLAWMQRSPDLAVGTVVHKLGNSLLLMQVDAKGTTARHRPAGPNLSLETLVDRKICQDPIVLLGIDDVSNGQSVPEPTLSMPHRDGHPPPVLHIAATLGETLFKLPDFLGNAAAKSASLWRRLTGCTVAAAAIASIALSCILFLEGRLDELRNTEAGLKAALNADSRNQKHLREMRSRLDDAQAAKDAAQRWQRSPRVLTEFMLRLDEAVQGAPSITVQLVQADGKESGGFRISGLVNDASATPEVQQLAKALGNAEIELRPAGAAVAFVITSLVPIPQNR